MLLRFVFENVLSFKEETDFNLLPAKSLKSHSDHLMGVNSRINVLKGAILYGANGAGKSNLFKAVDQFKRNVVLGKVPAKLMYIRNRMSDSNLPVQQSVEFSIDGKVYSYGISYREGLCLEEWLYDISGEKEKKIFERTYSETKHQPELSFGKEFDLKEKNQLLVKLLQENILKNDELLIAHRDIIKIQELNDVYDWFDKHLIVIFPDIKSTSIFNDMYSDDRFKNFAEGVFRGLDVGVDRLEFKKEKISEFLMEVPLMDAKSLEELKKNIDEDRAEILDTSHFTASLAKENGQYYVRRVITNHRADGKDYTFELKEESDGTQRLMDYIPMIKELDTTDRTYFVDEIDRSVHPNILLDMMRKLMANELKGQIICSSHESNLLDCDIFRTDEIWFAEKRREDQSTVLYPLSEFKPRNDLDIRKGYLKGRFGAIPFLGHTDDLKWETNDAVQK